MSLMLGDTVKIVKRVGIKTSGFIGKIIDFKERGYGYDKLVRVEFTKTKDDYIGYSTNWYLACHLILIEHTARTFDFKKDNPVKDIIKSDIELNGSCPIFRVPEGYTIRVVRKDFIDFGNDYPLVVKMMEQLEYTINNNPEKHCIDTKKQLEILKEIYKKYIDSQPIIFSVEKEIE